MLAHYFTNRTFVLFSFIYFFSPLEPNVLSGVFCLLLLSFFVCLCVSVCVSVSVCASMRVFCFWFVCLFVCFCFVCSFVFSCSNDEDIFLVAIVITSFMTQI